MKTLLFGGAPNTGKTASVVYAANYLTRKGFAVLDCQDYNGNAINLPRTVSGANQAKDFLAYLEGRNASGKKTKITVVSASDGSYFIDKNFDFLNAHPADIFISSMRDIGDERDYLLQKFNLADSGYIEFPLAKMSRKNNNWYTAKKWYDKTVSNMIEFILCNQPFGI